MASKLTTTLAFSARARMTGVNWKSRYSFQGWNVGDQEIVRAGDGGGLQQQPGLRAALLAGNQHLGDGGGFRVWQHAVHIAHEIAAQGDEEQHAQASARQADEMVCMGADRASGGRGPAA